MTLYAPLVGHNQRGEYENSMRKMMQVLALCLVLAFFAGCGKDGLDAIAAEDALEQTVAED